MGWVRGAYTSIAQKECTQKGDQPACVYQSLNAGEFKPKIDGNLDDWKYVKGVFLGADF